MRRFVVILLAALVLCSCVSAAEAEEQSVEQIVTAFMEENGLSEQNFSISYYNTVTGEAYAFNDTKFAIAASTYKLPLNMYFYEMEQEGLITGDTIIAGTGKTLDTCHQMSIVDSNNEVSELMMYHWGDHTTYKNNMRKYFSMTDEEIDPLYYQGNFYCVRMMMDTLKYLYDHSESFEELLGYMKIAAPDAYFKLGVQDYEVAHKYGEVQWFMNDTAIIYTPQPFLLAVYTQNVCSQQVLADIARLLTDYTVEKAAQTEQKEPETVELELSFTEVPKEEPVDAPQPELSSEEAPETSAVKRPVEEKQLHADEIRPEEPQKSRYYRLFAIPGILLVAGICLILNKKRS